MQTTKAGDAQMFALSAVSSGYKVIVAAGGDGTVNEVANGIMLSGQQIPMGIIPLGRGNDFAWCMHIPFAWQAAADIIIENKPHAIDLGYVSCQENGVARYFLNGTGFGFEPMVNFRAASYRHLNGMPSYLVAFLYFLLHTPKPVFLDAVADGVSVPRFETQQVSLCNGRRMGSAFIMGPFAKADDGVLDFVYAKHPIAGFGLLSYSLRFLKGTQLEGGAGSAFFYANVHSVSLAFSSPIPCHADGEVIAKENGKSYTVKVFPSSLFLCLPPDFNNQKM